MTSKSNTSWIIPAIMIALFAASLAGPAYSAFPDDCAERNTYVHFPRVPVNSLWCAEETGRMAALAGDETFTLRRGFISFLVSVPGTEDDFEFGIFDGDTGWADAAGDPHWDQFDTEIGFALFKDPDQVGSVDTADEITMVYGNATGNATAGPGWVAVDDAGLPLDYLPDNGWWNFECSSPCSLLDTDSLGADGNYHFHVLVLYDPDTATPDEGRTISNFKLRGRTSTVPIAFATSEFAFEGALHNLADVHTVFPEWDGTFPPAGSTFWIEEIEAGRTTYNGEWVFFANLPELTSLDLFDGDFDYGNDATAGLPLFPSGLLPGGATLPPCLESDDDDIDSFVEPNLEDPTVSWDFPDFVALDPLVPPTDPAYPVGEDDSLPQGAVLAGGFPTDNSRFDLLRREPCVTYRVTDPLNRVFDNLNPSSQREWEQFRICSQSAAPFGTEHCDRTVPDQLLPAGTWKAEIMGMDMSNLNTWHLEVQDVSNACLITVDKTATPPIAEPGSCDEHGRPRVLVFEYTGAECDPTGNSQTTTASCTGDPMGAEPVEIFLTKWADQVIISPDDIYVGDEVTFTATGGRDRLPPNLNLEISESEAPFALLQEQDIHTSCSEPLDVGDRFGALTLVRFDPANGGGAYDVTYTYVVTNNGDPLANVNLEDDKLGDVDGGPGIALAPGESQTFDVTTQIYENTTNIVTATGETGFGATCSAEDVAFASVTGVGGECNVAGVPALGFIRKDALWQLQNLSADTVTIDSIDVSWPQANSELREVHLNGKIFDADVQPPDATITSFIGGLADRQLAPGATKDLQFKFRRNADSGGAYTVVVDFVEGCSVELGGGV